MKMREWGTFSFGLFNRQLVQKVSFKCIHFPLETAHLSFYDLSQKTATPSTRISRKKLKWHARFFPFSHPYQFMIVKSIHLPLKSPMNSHPSMFTHEATIIFHLHYSNTLLSGSLSPGLAPFYLVWGTLQSWCCFEKQIWSHDSLVSNFSINPIALRRTAQFFWPFSPVQLHFASTCTTPSILLPRLNHFF